MRQTSYVWNELVENGEFHMDAVARIYGATGTDPDAVSGSDSDGSYREYVKITSPVINRSLLSGNILSIGNCVSGTLNFSIMTTDNIPKSAKIKIMGRVADGKDENPVQSDWLTFGTFWIDHRTVDDDFIDLECYDAMKMGNQLYDDPTPSAQWPRAVGTIVTRIAQQIGVSIDSRTTKYFSESGLWGQNIVTMPTSDTLNDILGHIGGILGGNWYITEENKLRYIPLISAPVDAGHILSHANDKITTDQGDYIIHGSIRTREADRDGGHITSHTNDKIISHVGDYIMWETLSGLNTIVNLGGTGCVVVPVIVGSMTTADSVSITRVTVSVNADTTYSYGVDGGFELIVSENPYATDALTAALYERVKGVVYSPYNITTAVYNPATELGDWVIAGDVVSSTIFTQNIRIGIGFDADISAPGENELENEFPYKTIEQKVTEKIETTETTLRQETVSAVENATNQITGANGSQIQFLYDENKIMKEIVIMDTNSTSTAQKVWRWNGNGFGYSKNGYNGPYGLAITQDGAIVADFLTVGIIKSPTNADTFWDLSKGELKIKGTGDTSPAIHVKTYMDGDVEKTKTEINADKITTGTFNADGNSVKIRGKLTDWNNSNNNYWNLDTGDFQVKGSSDTDYAIKVSNGKTDINATNITTGTLKNRDNNNNYWNLTNGTFKVQGANDNSAAIEVKNGSAVINASRITVGTIDENSEFGGNFVSIVNGKIDARELSANKITTGTISSKSGNTNYWNLSTGQLRIGSSDSDYAIYVNSNGVAAINASKITVGTISPNAIGNNSIPNAKLSGTASGGLINRNQWQINFNTGIITIGDISANSVVTGEIKNESNRNNYWNLNTGEFRLGSTNDSSGYAIMVTRTGEGTTEKPYAWNAVINANRITAGIIQDKKKINFWNLDEGRIRIGPEGNYAITVDSNGHAVINASKITAGSISISKFTTSAQNSLVSESQMTQLLPGVIQTMEIHGPGKANYWNLATGAFKLGTTYVDGEETSDTLTPGDAIKVNSKKVNGQWVIDKVQINADKINVGTLSVERIASIPSTKLENASLNNNWSINFKTGKMNIGNISANNITSGTIDTNLLKADEIAVAGVAKINELIVDGTITATYAEIQSISADLIKSGTLTLGGSGSNKPSLLIQDGSGNTIGTWDKNGLSILKGGLQLYSGRSEFVSNPSNGKCMALRGGALQIVDNSNINTIYGSIGYYKATTGSGVQIKAGSKSNRGRIYIGGNVSIENLKAIKATSGDGRPGSTGKTGSVTIKKGMSAKTLTFKNGILVNGL